jgi:hypothetical protein
MTDILRLLAVLIAVLVCSPRALADPMTFKIAHDDGAHWIEARGQVTQDSADRLRETLYEHRDKDIRTVFFDSEGGSILGAMTLGRMIRSQGLWTFVDVDDQCFSACFLAFLGGGSRFVAQSAELGTHQFSFAMSDLTREQAVADSQMVVADMIRYARDMGIDIEALARGFDTAHHAVYLFTAEEMGALGIGDHFDLMPQ